VKVGKDKFKGSSPEKKRTQRREKKENPARGGRRKTRTSGTSKFGRWGSGKKGKNGRAEGKARVTQINRHLRGKGKGGLE